MSFWHSLPAFPRQLASCVLTVVLLYQMGACPCGCLEHNFWVQMAGLGDHEEAPIFPAGEDVGTTLSDAHDHDCTGEFTPHYLDSARYPRVAEHSIAPLQFLLPHARLGCGIGLTPLDVERRRPDSLVVAHAPSRPVLQVYRL